MSISDFEDFKQRYPTARPVTYDGREYPSLKALARHIAAKFGVTVDTARYWLDKLGVDHKAITDHFRRHHAMTAPTAHSNAIEVVYKGQSFPSRGAFCMHLGKELGIPAATVSTALYAHSWDIAAAVAGLRANSARPPGHHQGLASLEAELGQTKEQRSPTPRLQNGGDASGDTVPAVPEPMATVLTEIGETIGLIRGTYEAREAALIAVTRQLDPAVGRKLADIENQFARQAASFRALEQQLKREHQSRAQAEEILVLVNRKLTQLVHDLKLEALPKPTRRDPTAG